MAEGSKKSAVGVLGAGAVAAVAKGGAFVLAHLGLLAKPAAVGHLAADAAHVAPALVHAAPTLAQDAGTVISHAAPLIKDGAEAATHSSSLLDDGAKSVGRVLSRPNQMSDGERIARSAAGVAKYYARRGIRQAGRNDRDENRSKAH